MNSDMLRQRIRNASLVYARKRNFPIKEYSSAIIFRNPCDNFHPESFSAIVENSDWKSRTEKSHQNVKGAYEMQSSNSSDALLMNIFCHPALCSWAGIRKIIGADVSHPGFGHPAGVRINNGQMDKTEIDMVLPGIFCEAKLTETDFTEKMPYIVESYDSFKDAFHVDDLPRIGDNYDNYQIIRNLLATIEQNCNHILFCDERRPDLARRYMVTVSCLRDISIRRKCRVIFWQELAAACGESLGEWLWEKYQIGSA